MTKLSTSTRVCSMANDLNRPDVIDLDIMLDDLIGAELQQSNCMFQLALMLARIALEPVSESYKDEMAQALLGLIRSKPKSSVVQMFGGARPTTSTAPRMLASA